MDPTPQQLQTTLDDIARYLKECRFAATPATDRSALVAEVERLAARLRKVREEALHIGLLGGTGVGKSTLMNALAGAEIASTSHRRPHTDRVLVYRHRNASLPAHLVNGSIPYRDYPHDVAAIVKILLYDLPDFDSLLGQHRETVQAFMAQLDLLVWVTSPEKYADASFYQFLQRTPKSPRNYYFVINKIDLVFHGRGPEEGYLGLESISGSFRTHLTNAGISQPLVYLVSAREILEGRDPSPWNQFPSLQHHVLQQRDVKAVSTIKAANLDIEIEQIVAAIENELSRLQQLQVMLTDLRRHHEQQRAQWLNRAQGLIDVWLRGDVRAYLLSALDDPDALVGAGHAIALIMRHRPWRRDPAGPAAERLDITPPPELLRSIEQHRNRLEHQLHHELLRRQMNDETRQELQRLVNDELRGEAALEPLLQTVHATFDALEPLRPTGFKLFQGLGYGFLLLLFVWVLGGETAWHDLFTRPCPDSAHKLFFSFARTLFSPGGLAAIGSYAVLNVFLAFRFYHRYKKFLRRRVQKIIESLKMELLAQCDEVWNDLDHRLEQMATLVNDQLERAKIVRERREGS